MCERAQRVKNFFFAIVKTCRQFGICRRAQRHHQFSVWLFIVPCSVCVLCSVFVCSVRYSPPRSFVVRRCSSLFVVQWSNDHSCKRTCRVVSLNQTTESTKRKGEKKGEKQTEGKVEKKSEREICVCKCKWKCKGIACDAVHLENRRDSVSVSVSVSSSPSQSVFESPRVRCGCRCRWRCV